MKWINEIMRQITAKTSVTRQNEQEWAEQDIWEMMQGYLSQNPAIQADLNNAILQSYTCV